MANTKVPSELIADNSVGITQLNVSDGTNGQVLTTDGAGTLSFSTISGYTDSDVESYLDTGTSTPTFGAMNTNGAITLGNASYWIGNATNGYRFNNSADTANLLVIKDNGGVGIGTSSPTQGKVDILDAGDYDAHTGHGLTINSNANNAYTSMYMGADDSIDAAYIQSAGRNTSFTSKKLLLNPNGGNVSIGTTTTFSNPLTTNQTGGAAGSSNNQIAFTHTGASNAYHIKSIRASATDEVVGLDFVENTTSRVRFGAGGEVQINNSFTGSKLHVKNSGQDTSNWCTRYYTTHTSNPNYIVDFIDYEGQRMGYISGNPSANTLTYNTSSDYRLKENVSYDWDATTRLKQLKPARFNWIRDESNTLVDGFLAHEVEDIVPEAITGEKDATETKTNVVLNSYGNWIADNITEEEWETGKQEAIYDADTTWAASHTQNLYQYIDQAKLVPLLVKALQESNAKIEALETRIETLENS